MLGQLENPLHYKTVDSDPSENYVSTISGWSNKWLHKGQIDQDVANWVVNSKTRPGKAFGTIKTYKEGKPAQINYFLLWDNHSKSFGLYGILS